MDSLDIYVLITLREDGFVGFTHLLGPYAGLCTGSERVSADPPVRMHLYWSPDQPDDIVTIVPGLEKYINEILHGNPRYRRITRNYPVRLER
jgi:hypothetical protein